MSYDNGWSAINLEMTDKVPRTEYSAAEHWKLVKEVTGIEIKESDDYETKRKAGSAFMKAWDFCMIWSVLVGSSYIPGKKTSMGHAVYAEGGTDFTDNIYCPFNEPEDVLNFDPYEEYGKINISKMTEEFNQSYKNNCMNNPDTVNMTGIYITCVSGLIEMFGWDELLMAAGIDSEKFGYVTDRYCKWIMQHFEALANCDAPVVMVHDDIVWTSGAFINPQWYRKFVFPNYKKLFAPLIESGKKILYTSDGNFTQFIDDIAQCGVNGFVLEPMTDMSYIAEKYGSTHVFVGNADTRILYSGTKDDIYNEVKRCMDIGKKCPGFFMAVGNHIPANTPVENCLFYNEVFEELRKR